MLDQFVCFSCHLPHVHYVPVADVGTEDRVELCAVRIFLRVESPCGDGIVGFASEIEVGTNKSLMSRLLTIPHGANSSSIAGSSRDERPAEARLMASLSRPSKIRPPYLRQRSTNNSSSSLAGS